MDAQRGDRVANRELSGNTMRGGGGGGGGGGDLIFHNVSDTVREHDTELMSEICVQHSIQISVLIHATYCKHY